MKYRKWKWIRGEERRILKLLKIEIYILVLNASFETTYETTDIGMQVQHEPI